MPLLDETGAPVKRSWNTFRIHDSGDFDSPEEANRWRNIVAKNPDITFYAYTKSYSQPKIWETLKGMHKEFPNFKIIQSVGGRQDEKIDPNMPHAVIFENDDQLRRAQVSLPRTITIPVLQTKTIAMSASLSSAAVARSTAICDSTWKRLTAFATSFKLSAI